MPFNTETESDYLPSRIGRETGRFVMLSGCSGAGKSSLLAELARRGFAIYEEPGRQIVREQLHIGGDALPWKNLEKFVELTVSRSIHHLVRGAGGERLSFFDRGIIDQISALQHAGLPVPAHLETAARRCRYREKVFMLPPWREIFRNDSERRHGFDEAAANYQALLLAYQRFGYQAVPVPKLCVSARADFVIENLRANLPDSAIDAINPANA